MRHAKGQRDGPRGPTARARKAHQDFHRIFHVLIRHYVVDPNGVVFIDDTPANVAAATELGFHGIDFTSPDSVRSELAALGCSQPPTGLDCGYSLTEQTLSVTHQIACYGKRHPGCDENQACQEQLDTAVVISKQKGSDRK
jgi:hypothetical protein